MVAFSTRCFNGTPVIATILAVVLAAAGRPAALIAGPGGTRIKDITSLQGAYSVPLIGYGLVVGLNKTGDKQQTLFPAQTLANMLERFGVAVPGGTIKIENIAAVMVISELPQIRPYWAPAWT